MELPSKTVELPQDEYDHELTQLQTDFIALSDVLLERKSPDSRLSFVDIEANRSASQLYELIKQTHLGDALLASDEDQLAIESDGSYYPRLDVRKHGAKPDAAWIRVFGWDEPKWRLINHDPHEVMQYDEAIDKTREINILFHYTIDGENVSESLHLQSSTRRQGGVDICSVNVCRSISMMAYCETGYDGHGLKFAEYDDSDTYELLDIIARSIDNQ